MNKVLLKKNIIMYIYKISRGKLLFTVSEEFLFLMKVKIVDMFGY